MNKIKAGLILSLAIAIVGCGPKRESTSGQSGCVKRMGEIAGAEVSLPIAGSLIGHTYLNKLLAEVALESETKPGKIAILTEQLRAATKKWEDEKQAFEKEIENLRALCVEEPKWTEKEKAVFRSYSGKALATCDAVEIKYREKLTTVDSYISVYRHGTQEEIDKARGRLFEER